MPSTKILCSECAAAQAAKIAAGYVDVTCEPIAGDKIFCLLSWKLPAVPPAAISSASDSHADKTPKHGPERSHDSIVT